jgi:hypothetical protein
MGIKATPEVKYALIHEAIHQVSSELNVSELCQIAGVSRSGYYAWIKAAPLRVEREEADKRDFAFISLIPCPWISQGRQANLYVVSSSGAAHYHEPEEDLSAYE